MASVLIIDNRGYLETDLKDIPDIVRVGDDLGRALRELQAKDLVFAFVHGTWHGLTHFRAAARKLRVPHLVYSGASPKLRPEHLRKHPSSLVSLVVKLKAGIEEIPSLERAVLNELGGAWRSYVQGELVRATATLSGIRLLANGISTQESRQEFLAIVDRCLELAGPESPTILGCEMEIHNLYESLTSMRSFFLLDEPTSDHNVCAACADRLIESLESLTAKLSELSDGRREL